MTKRNLTHEDHTMNKNCYRAISIFISTPRTRNHDCLSSNLVPFFQKLSLDFAHFRLRGASHGLHFEIILNVKITEQWRTVDSVMKQRSFMQKEHMPSLLMTNPWFKVTAFEKLIKMANKDFGRTIFRTMFRSEHSDFKISAVRYLLKISRQKSFFLIFQIDSFSVIWLVGEIF